MNNIKFNYLYRDGSNYKKWGDVVFSNADRLTIDSITKKLRSHFLEDGLFIAHQIRVPNVFLTDDYPLTEDDHCYHEFYGIETTDEHLTDNHNRSVKEFLDEVAHQAKIGWRAFLV